MNKLRLFSSTAILAATASLGRRLDYLKVNTNPSSKFTYRFAQPYLLRAYEKHAILYNEEWQIWVVDGQGSPLREAERCR